MIPERLNVWICPACGRVVAPNRRVNIDERRKECVPTIHKAMPVEVPYVRDHGERE